MQPGVQDTCFLNEKQNSFLENFEENMDPEILKKFHGAVLDSSSVIEVEHQSLYKYWLKIRKSSIGNS